MAISKKIDFVRQKLVKLASTNRPGVLDQQMLANVTKFFLTTFRAGLVRRHSVSSSSKYEFDFLIVPKNWSSRRTKNLKLSHSKKNPIEI